MRHKYENSCRPKKKKLTELQMFAKILKETKKMAQTLAELQSAITAITASVEKNTVAVDADVAQTALVVTAVEALVAKIDASGNTDFTAEVTALSDATAKMEATTDKLALDNAAVQEALDKAATK